MPEELFWETMTPARLIALYDSFLVGGRASVSKSDAGGEPMGLYSAIMEMGGS
jgi:hypothetical protein